MLMTDGGHLVEGVVQQFLTTLCARYPRGRLCRFTVTSQTPKPTSSEWLGFPAAVGDQPWEMRGFWLPAKLTKFSERPADWWIRTVHSTMLARQAAEFGRRHSTELVFAVLNNPGVVYTARRTAEALNVPLVVAVLDPPEWLARGVSLRGRHKTRFMREFKRTLRASDRVAVASEGMREHYAVDYGIHPGPVLIQGIDDSWRVPPRTTLADEEHFFIGFAGNIYAKKEFASLLQALQACDWQLGSRKVVIRVLGRQATLDAAGPANIEYHGSRHFLGTIKFMAGVDVCYVPYWLDGPDYPSTQICFPNKVSTYLAAGRPLFVHAPETSSPARFANKFGLGACCSTRDPADILRSLERYMADADYYASCARATQHALDEELSLSVFLSRFADLVGASADDLLRPESVDLDSLLSCGPQNA
jgi:glycosyltransferase involved in cell wall biosynthesis